MSALVYFFNGHCIIHPYINMNGKKYHNDVMFQG